MSYKALLADFDNTMIGDDGRLSESLKKAITKMLDAGYIFSIATGRPYFDKINDVCDELQLKDLVIVHGGAHIVNPENGAAIWQENINPLEIRPLLSFFSQNNIRHYCLEGNNCVYTQDGQRYKPFDEKTVFKPMSQFTKQNVPKIIISASASKYTESQVDDIIKKLKDQFKDIFVIKVKVGAYFGFDITSEKASKHLAVHEYARLMHLEKDEIVGVGDGYNDFPLLTACGMKVAMGNSVKELKDIADFIAPAQKNDGLAAVIDKFFR